MEVQFKALLRTAQKNQFEQFKERIDEVEKYQESFDSNDQQFLSRCRNSAGDSLLHIAARSGHLDILRFLIEEKKMVIDLKNRDRKTPLHDAAQFSQLSCVQFLLQNGADVNAVKKADWTPLMLACTKQDHEVVSTLLQNEADLYFQNKDGWNSFHIACREGNILVIKSLLSVLSSRERILLLCNSTSKNGRKPLHTAAMHGHLEVVKFILDNHFSDVNVLDNCGTTPLMDACRSGSVELTDSLVRVYNSDLSIWNKDGFNCLHVAAEAGASAVVVLLVRKYQMDINLPVRNSHETALEIATKATQEDTVEAIRTLIYASTDLQF